MRLITTIIGILILLAGGAYFLFKDNTVTLKFTEPELRQKLEEKMPFSEDYLFIFNVTLENPRIDLIEGSDRVAGGLDAVLNIAIGDSDVPINGALDVSGAMRYAPEEGAFYLTDPRIETVQLRGVPDGFANRANNALSEALREFYRERPIYVLSEEDMRQRTAKMVLRDVIVKDETLHVTLGLAKNAE